MREQLLHAGAPDTVVIARADGPRRVLYDGLARPAAPLRFPYTATA